MRRFFRGTMAWVLSLSLFLLASSVALQLTLGNAAYIKATLEKSGVYKTFVSATLDLAKLQSSNQKPVSADPKTVDDLVPIISASITPMFLQTTTESVIDAAFLWLNKDVAQPQISIKTSDLQVQLKTQLVAYLNAKVTNLPNCSQNTNYADFDILNATCKPAVTISQETINATADDVIAAIPLFQQEEISMQTIDPNNNFANSTINTAAPNGFSWFKRAPYVVLALIVASGIGVILLGNNSAKTWRTVGHTFVWAGIMLVVSGGITILVANNLSGGFFGSASGEQLAFVKAVFAPIFQILTKSLGNYALYFGIGYAVIGAGCYIVSHNQKLRETAADNTEDSAPNCT